ncbi:MAG: hypothetical protein ABEI39_04770 [Halobacteriales archaeon]
MVVPKRGSLGYACWAGILALAVLTIVVLSLPAAAHGNSITADSQVSTNGTVRIEFISAVTDAFVVLHTPTNDTLGRVIGHRALGDGPVHRDLTVRIRPAVWTNVTTSLPVTAALHYDENGNGEFDPATDPPLRTATTDELVASRFTVRKESGNINVLAEDDHPQRTNTSTVAVRQVTLAEPGYLVIRADANGSLGRIVGHRALSGDVHRNVNVSLAEEFYHEQPREFVLWAAVYLSNGDDSFDTDTDTLITSNGSAVATRFMIERTGNVSHGDDHDHTTATQTPTPTPTTEAPTTGSETPTTTEAPATETPSPTTATTHRTSTQTETPGFGIGVLLLAVGIVAVLLRYQ